jgi:hypothetical protein
MTTVQLFCSLEFTDGDVVASLEGFSSAANRAQLGRRRRFFREIAHPEIPLQSLGRKVGRAAVPPLGGSIYLSRDRSWQLNGVRSSVHLELGYHGAQRCQCAAIPRSTGTCQLGE